MRACSFLLLILFIAVPSFAEADEAPTTRPAKGQKKVLPDPIGEPVVYKKADGKDLRLWVVKPDGWKADDQRPAMVLIHGGGWRGGQPALHNNQADFFAKRGMVCVLVEYRVLGRGAKVAPLDLPCQDAKSAMRYVRSHAKELGIDPNRIAASGSSAGGHLSAFVGVVEGIDDPKDDLKVSAKPNAMLLICPVVDLSERVFNHERVGERWKEFSPLHHVAAGAPPALVLIGEKDQYIKIQEIEEFQRAMKKVDARCDVKVYPGLEHGFFQTPRWQAKALADCDEFLVSLGWLPMPTTRATASELQTPR